MSQHQIDDSMTCIVCEKAFSPEELDRIEQMGDAMVLQKAVMAGEGWATEGRPDAIRLSHTARMAATSETDWLYRRIHGIMHTVNRESYQFALTGFSEAFQYTVYHGNEGGHYSWHIDLGPGEKPRKLSLSLQLSADADYEGGDLQFQGSRPIETAPRERGTAIVFPAYTLHRVTPVTAGTRKSLVVWAAGPKFK